MGFMDFFIPGSGGGGDSKTIRKAPSKAEKTIATNVASQSTQAMPLFEQLLGQSRSQGGFSDDLYNQFQQQMQAFNQGLTPAQQGQMQAIQQQQQFGLGQNDQQMIAQALGLAGQGAGATPEQLAAIQQATDLATQSGLSDLGRYRDDTLATIAQNSAQRGMRPTDTPIFNESSAFGQESGRQAEQLVRGLRQQQAEQILQYPMTAGQFQMGQLGSASDMANRRQGFLANLGAQNTENQMNFGRGIQSQGLGLAQGFSGAESLPALVSQRQFQPGSAGGGGGSGVPGAQLIGTALSTLGSAIK